MTRIETQELLPPVRVERRRSRQFNIVPIAAFTSQLIAEQDRAPLPQCERRQASPAGAVGAYRAGAAISVARMPEGFRKTVLA